MPFTLYHLGAGALIKSAKPTEVSFLMFAGSQVAMDLEPLIRLTRGELEVHGFSHTFLGASLILLACLPFRGWVNRYIPTSWRAAAIGAAAGVYSHLLLDGFLHQEMHYFWMGWLSWETVEWSCIGMAVVGTTILALQGELRRTWEQLRKTVRLTR